ncbi:LysR substrate-binding domain-containing protein, partial [Streptomyces sp. SAS_270]|uniref:LysR substrate-binding domain-containing protein n=1 Tax=Streptomyces sp. SAS_270 TaxID=3412748 RepID=UPI00403C414F
VADLVDEVVLHPLDDVLVWERLPGRAARERPATTEDAVELVAAGVGVLLVPQSLARLYHRKDLTYRPVTDAPVGEVALAWPQEATTDLVEDFIGIVRGRTANSTRGRRPPATQQDPAGKTAGKTDGKAAGRTAGKAAGKNSRAATGAGKNAKSTKSKGTGNAKSARSAGAGKRGKPRRRA